MSRSELKLSLLDVARVAKVQRPVVSAWRARSKHTDTPFPAPCATTNRQELFAAEEIVTWLQRTGRGNNPDAAQDIALYTVDARDHVKVLSALLVLRAFIGRDLHGMDPEDVVDHADELDLDDEFLFTQIDRAGKNYDPSEWFIVPLNVINQAISTIMSGEITDYVYDPAVQRLVERS